MNQYLSVLAAAARSTVYKMTVLLVLLGAAESALFLRLLQQMENGQLYALEDVFQKSGIPFAFAVAFIIVCGLLSSVGRGAKYTLRRMAVSEFRVHLLWSAYSTACFLILWAAQLLIVLLLCRWYLAVMDPAYWNGQTVFLAFYRSGFLHSLLPLAEFSRWVRNLMLVCALGLSRVSASIKGTRRQMAIKETVLGAFAILSFSAPMGNLAGDIFVSVFAAAVGGFCLYTIWEEAYHEV